MSDFNLDTNKVKYDASGLPVGVYKVMCTGEAIKQREGKAKRYIATYEIVSGDFKGKSSEYGYNLFHENPSTVNIAEQELKRIADATNSQLVFGVSGETIKHNFAPLKGRVFGVVVTPQKGSDTYTTIAKYLSENDEKLNDFDIPL